MLPSLAPRQGADGGAAFGSDGDAAFGSDGDAPFDGSDGDESGGALAGPGRYCPFGISMCITAAPSFPASIETVG